MVATNDARTLASLAQQLHLLLESGLSVDQGLALLAEHDPAGVWSPIEAQYQRSRSLGQTLRDLNYPTTFVNSLELALASGQASTVLGRLQAHYQAKADHRNQLEDLLRLPLSALIVMVVLLSALSFGVLPRLHELLRLFNQMQPLWMLGVRVALQGVSGLFILLLIGVWVWRLWVHHQVEKDAQQPDVLERLLNLSKAAQHARDQSDLLHLISVWLYSGASFETIKHEVFAQLRSGTVRSRLEAAGAAADLSTWMSEAQALSPLDQSTLELAAQSGQLETTLDHLATRSTKHAHRVLDQHLERLEPYLMSVVVAIMALVLVALLSPLVMAMRLLG
jgi:type IV pilus assembly protein PilC